MTRRRWIQSAGLGLAWVPATASAAGSSFPTSISATPKRAFRTPGPHPNGLQASPEGLWVLDQQTNRASLVRFEDGSVIREFATETDRGSGITVEGAALWIASTYNRLLVKVDARTGKTLKELPSPGSGFVKWSRPGPKATPTGAHGLEYRNGELWVSVPPSATIYAVNPDGGAVLRSFPAPGIRPHGLGWDPDGSLWCAETNLRSFFKMSPKTGKILRQLMLPFTEPQAEGVVLAPHGMTIWRREIWFSVAETGEIYRMAAKLLT
ncbi:MAG: hypothetical protein AAB225_17150 [Acidobacteriota bacterium]